MQLWEKEPEHDWLERAGGILEKDDSQVQCRGIGEGSAAAAGELIDMMDRVLVFYLVPFSQLGFFNGLVVILSSWNIVNLADKYKYKYKLKVSVHSTSCITQLNTG